MAPHDRFDEVGYFVVPERVGRPPPQLETREDGRAASPRASCTSPYHVRPLRSLGPALYGTPDGPSRRWARSFFPSEKATTIDQYVVRARATEPAHGGPGGCRAARRARARRAIHTTRVVRLPAQASPPRTLLGPPIRADRGGIFAARARGCELAPGRVRYNPAHPSRPRGRAVGDVEARSHRRWGPTRRLARVTQTLGATRAQPRRAGPAHGRVNLHRRQGDRQVLRRGHEGPETRRADPSGEQKAHRGGEQRSKLGHRHRGRTLSRGVIRHGWQRNVRVRSRARTSADGQIQNLPPIIPSRPHDARG